MVKRTKKPAARRMGGVLKSWWTETGGCGPRAGLCNQGGVLVEVTIIATKAGTAAVAATAGGKNSVSTQHD